ncbi:MAG: hypothetical protein RR232_03435 [Clostridia bacterium]
MYISPVPLMVIRADTTALIEVNGQRLGECGEDSFVALPVSDTGDYYICAIPLTPLHYPVTRRLRFEGGALALVPQGVTACVWPGGVYELTVDCGSFDFVGAAIPRPVDTLTDGDITLTLYYENGLKLVAEREAHPPAGFSLGEATNGSIGALTFGGTRLLYIRAIGKKERLLMLTRKLDTVLDIEGDFVSEQPAVIDDIGTLMGHQRRTIYACASGEFIPQPPVIGFFTREYEFPKGGLMLATAFCEAVREGFEAEAQSYMTQELRLGLAFKDVCEFFGDFEVVQPPLSDKSGRYMGLIAQDGEHIKSARLYEFEFSNGLISNITEA